MSFERPDEKKVASAKFDEHYEIIDPEKPLSKEEQDAVDKEASNILQGLKEIDSDNSPEKDRSNKVKFDEFGELILAKEEKPSNFDKYDEIIDPEKPLSEEEMDQYDKIMNDPEIKEVSTPDEMIEKLKKTFDK